MDNLKTPTVEKYRDKIATVDKDGKRVWLYPKKPKGWYYDKRKLLSYAMLLFLFGMPFVKVNGQPLLLFNVLERKFILFGMYFGPQDFYLFVLGMLIFIVFIALFTVVFGRVFCGWICPQTIFMEMVYRRIEYWIEGDANAQKRLNKAPWTRDKIIKKVGKQIIFFGIAVLVANTFLSYIIGQDQVFQIASEPIGQHLGGFIAMIIFSFLFYGVFSVLREQVCVTICPYGRLQGVLLDKNSIAVYYDFERGEPRGKKKRKPKKDAFISLENQIIQEPQLGDCIDCKLCVQVCPTGIDIRDGVQLECVNCTACMDACDEVMEKIDRPKELIRYDSYNGIVSGNKKIFNPRVLAYSAVLLALIGVEIALFTMRADVQAVILRTPGMLFNKTPDGQISNLYNFQLINKTSDTYPVTFKLKDANGKLQIVGESPTVEKNNTTEGAFFIIIPPDELAGRKTNVTVEVWRGEELVDEVKTNFLGPMK